MCCLRSSRSTNSIVEMWVASSTTGGATPASKASFQRAAQRHHRSPGFKPGKSKAGLAVIRSFPRTAREFQEFGSHFGTHDVQPIIRRSRAATTVAIKSGPRRQAARLQFRAQDILGFAGRHRLLSEIMARPNQRGVRGMNGVQVSCGSFSAPWITLPILGAWASAAKNIAGVWMIVNGLYWTTARHGKARARVQKGPVDMSPETNGLVPNEEAPGGRGPGGIAAGRWCSRPATCLAECTHVELAADPGTAPLLVARHDLSGGQVGDCPPRR